MRKLLLTVLMLSCFSAFGQKQILGFLKPYSAPACPNNLTLLSLTNWVYDVADSSYKPVTGNNGEGLALLDIPADGYIQAYYSGADSSYNTAIFLTSSEAPSSPYYENVDFGLYVASSENYNTAINGSYTDLGVSAVAGDLFQVIRTGTTVKARYYRSGSWTDLYTYTTGSTGSLFLGASSADPGWVVKVTRLKYCDQ